MLRVEVLDITVHGTQADGSLSLFVEDHLGSELLDLHTPKTVNFSAAFRRSSFFFFFFSFFLNRFSVLIVVIPVS